MAWAAHAQTGIIVTVAGTTAEGAPPVRGFGGDDGPSPTASLALANLQNTCDPNQFEQAVHLAVDPAGNLLIMDAANQRIRRITPAWTIGTVAGSGERPQVNARCEPSSPVADGGPALSAFLYNPADVAIAPNGNLIIADQQNNRIRQIAPDGTITTIAGNGLHNIYAPGVPALNSPMDWPSAVAVDARGTVYFAEVHGNRVARIGADGRLATVAGTGFPGYAGDNVPATGALLRSPMGIALDADGNLFIADRGNHRVRKVSAAGIISAVAGNGQRGYSGDGGLAASASLDTPMDVKVDTLGNIFIADTGNNRVRRVGPDGVITTVAGDGHPARGPDGVAADTSSLYYPAGLAVDATTICISWTGRITWCARSSSRMVRWWRRPGSRTPPRWQWDR